MSEGSARIETWEMRLVSRLGLGPVPAGLLVTGGFLLVYVAVESRFGPLLEDPFTPEVFGFGVAAVLAGYAVAAGRAIGAAQQRVLEQLGPVMQVPEPDPEMLALARWWGAGAVALAGVFMYIVDGAVRELVTRERFTTDGLLSLLFVPFTFYLVVRVTFLAMGFLFALADAARRTLEVDLLAPERLAPLGRAGLHGSLLFIGAAALASLSVVGSGGSAIEDALIGVLLLTATAAFLYPVRGASARIRAAKQRELARVRAEIRSDRERLPSPGAAARLPALLAWEARVERVSEWPFDADTLVRFALLLLLPLLSWLGGALVERAVDAIWW